MDVADAASGDALPTFVLGRWSGCEEPVGDLFGGQHEREALMMTVSRPRLRSIVSSGVP
ncbi:hypothetical protein [Actinomadura sp. 3N508]|uniref:hypothetical protein n=1 Tax=Actinomadura sp. 3N508 TaxID=3375153 RepID=UPI0037945DB9